MSAKNFDVFGVIGGDRRQLYLAKSLEKSGKTVPVAGFDKLTEDFAPALVSLKTAVRESDAVILPVPSLRADGKINAPFASGEVEFDGEICDLLLDKPIFTTNKPRLLRAYPVLEAAEVYDYAARDDFAVLNAVPTAEGAVECAMSGLERTIFGSRCLVAGFGRIGKILCRMLSALNAEVWAAARKPADLAYIRALGYNAVDFAELKSIKGFDAVFNTVPSRILEMLPYIDFHPDIIHCNDWQTALVPVYYYLFYSHRPWYFNIKSLFTIHNIQYQGEYGWEVNGECVGIPASEGSILDMNGKLNMMKGAIETATRVSTVSPSYAAEIKDPWFSWGLHDELNLRHYKLCGIKNGIDVESYNPETDYQLYRNYSKDDMSGKGECKRALQERLCLEQRWDVPMVGMVTRLVQHKGLDLVRMGLEDLMNTENMQFVILGSGDKEYEDYFNYMQARYPGRLCFCHGFVPELARKIYSGADIFLMPSAQEPCGLAQMIALRYGTIPVVREVGGLKDSVFDSADNYGNGFTFKNYECADMQLAVRRALWGIQDAQGWHQLMWRAMMSDNSWDRSAQDYINLYNDTMKWA